MKMRIASLLLASTLLASAAQAQTAAPATGAAAMTPAGTFVTSQSATQYRASKLVGVTIYGSENQKVGDVNDILLDGNGTAQAIVVGVGGFLGVGEKNVALPFSSVAWSDAKMGATPVAPTMAPNTTGATGTTAQQTAAQNGYPDHGMIRMTKTDLQNAPGFKYFEAK